MSNKLNFDLDDSDAVDIVPLHSLLTPFLEMPGLTELAGKQNMTKVME
jgi:hypothetical protein